MRDRLISIILFIVVSSVYYATTAGLTSSNDGSHYALLRALADEDRFEIATYAHFAEGNDLSIRDEIIYSDRPPGTAVLGLPFYAMGGILPRPIHDLPTRHDEGNPRLAYLMLLPVFAGAGTVVILYNLLRSYELSEFASLTTSLAYAFATTSWKYGSVLYSHGQSALLMIAAVMLSLIAYREGRLRWWIALWLGLSLGLSVLVDYSSAVLVVLIALYLLVTLNRTLFTGERWWLSLLVGGVTALIPVIFLMAYNQSNFGGPFTTSYKFAINYPWAASFSTTFDTPLSQGLPGMLWYGLDGRGEENQGIFLLMPVMLIGLAGCWYYLKNRWRESILVLGIFLVFLLLYARHHTFSGFTADGRYLMPYLSLWFVPVGFALDRLDQFEPSTVKTVLLFLAYGLIFLSVRNMAAHIVFSYNYHLDPGLVARRAATPANWTYILRSLFVNWRNLPILWLVEAVIGGIGAGVMWARKKQANPASDGAKSD